MTKAAKKATSGYEIEDDVDIPIAKTKYPWPQMQVGQSVVVPKGASSSARGFVKRYRPGIEIVERTVEADDPKYDESEPRIRVWFTDAPDEDKEADAEIDDEGADPEQEF